MRNRPLRTYALLLLCALTCSCVVSKRDVSADLPRNTIADLFEKDIDRISWKMKLKLSDGQRTASAKGLMRIAKNDRISISLVIPLLGMEVARVDFGKDSVVILDKYHKRYAVSGYKTEGSGKHPALSFEIVQSLLLNEMFVPFGTNAPQDFGSFAIGVDSKGQKACTLKGTSATLRFALNKKNLLCETFVADADNSLRWTYARFARIAGINFPKNMHMELLTRQKLLSTEMTLQNITPGEADMPKPRIPSRYEKVTISALLQDLI